MKKKWEVFSKIILFSTIFFVVFSLCFSHQSNALVYQKDAQIGFTVNEIINVTLSGNLSISDLVPGGQKDSNSISVTVRTNGALGYTLSATAGSTTNNSTDLVLDASNKISSISTSANLSTLSTDNTWGYRLSDDNSTWGNYNGLALVGGTATVLKDTSSMPTGGTDITYFKIGAKASSELAVGSYTNKVTFYAVAKTTPTVTTPYMQDVVEWADTLDVNESMQVKDARDDKIYWVTRLADGNIWMTQNLDLDLDSSVALTPDDSDVTANWTPEYSTATASSGTWLTSSSSASSYDPGDNYIPNGTDLAVSASNLTENSTDLHYHQGNYYNWYAATAGSNANNLNDGSEAPDSICPKGWRLPYGNTANKGWYYLLNDTLGLDETTIAGSSPAYMIYSGGYNNGLEYVGGDEGSGAYWSSTASNLSNAYILGFDAYYVGFNSTSGLLGGFDTYGASVRCVANTYMQNVASWGDTLNTGDSIQVEDFRDGKLYWVTKLADGNIWMTQNLDLDLSSSVTLTPSDTNIASNWTPSTSTYAASTTTWNESNTTPESYDPGDLCWNGNLNTSYSGTLATETGACTSSNRHYHIGNYYNWTAAVAMNDSTGIEDGDVVVMTQSICPKGWTLPLSGDNTGSGSFINLTTQYGWDENESTMTGSYQMWDAPLSFVLGGYYWNSSVYYVATYVGYWSSVVYDSDYAFASNFSTSGWVGSQNVGNRYLGYSVRCVAAQ